MFKEDIEEAEVLEHETAKATLEDKKFGFPKPYYKQHNFFQTPTKIEKEKQLDIDDYLKLTSAYFEEDIHAAKNINKDNYRNLISSTKEKIENDLIVNDKPTFENCFINDEYVEPDFDITEKDKAFTHY